MDGKNYAGAAWNAMMEEESKESVMEMLFDAWDEVREQKKAIKRLEAIVADYEHTP